MDLLVYFFKQKTAYELRISDLSSDVCSSDLSSPASREFLQSLLVSFDHQSRSSTNVLTGYMRGKLFTLPAGNVIGLVGAESQKQTVRLETESPSFIGSNINGSSESRASFAEVRVPVWSPRTGEELGRAHV